MPTEAEANHNVPLPALIGLGTVMGLAILGAALGRHGATTAAHPPADVKSTRLLAFTDMPSGEVAVTDADNGRPIALLPRGADNFIRATVRDLVHARTAPEPAPMQLTAWRDGRLTLRDTADGRTLELEAFGPTNAADFARLLTAEATP